MIYVIWLKYFRIYWFYWSFCIIWNHIINLKNKIRTLCVCGHLKSQVTFLRISKILVLIEGILYILKYWILRINSFPLKMTLIPLYQFMLLIVLTLNIDLTPLTTQPIVNFDYLASTHISKQASSIYTI